MALQRKTVFCPIPNPLVWAPTRGLRDMTDDLSTDSATGGCEQSLPCVSKYLDDCPSDVECQAIIQALIEKCPECNDTYLFEMRVRTVVSTRCADQTPDALKSKIFQAIQDAQRDC